MSKKLLKFAVLCVFGMLLVFSACDVTSSYGAFDGLNYAYANRQWTIAAASADGYTARTFNLNAGELSALRATSSSTAGNVYLTVWQGSVYKTFPITAKTDEPIDTDFIPGSIRLQVVFKNAAGVNVTISWAV